MRGMNYLSSANGAAFVFTAIVAMAFPGSQAFAQSITGTNTNQVTISVSSNVVRDHTVPGASLVLGFNLEAAGFQQAPGTPPGPSNLWDSTNNVVRPSLYNFLSSDFNGSIYRYPGGTDSQYFDWYRTVGSSASRQSVYTQYSSYFPNFGFDEYMKFVNTAQGVPQIVLNMSRKDNILITDANWPAAEKSLLGFLEYCDAPPNQDWNGDGVYQGALRPGAAYNITRWELGNEMDTIMALSTYRQRCANVIADFKAAASKINLPLQFIPVSGSSNLNWNDWNTWNNNLLNDTLYTDTGVGQWAYGLAYHPYYDGLSIPNYLFNEGYLKWSLNTYASTSAKIAITEHGKWPSDVNNTATWTGDTDLGAAISNADWLISQEQEPRTGMALAHSLDSWGPWCMFTATDSSGNLIWGSTAFSPHPLAYALKLIQRVMQNVDILSTSIVTPGNAGYPWDVNYASYYPNIHYDVRATGYRNASNGQYGVLLENRASYQYPYTLKLQFPGWPQGSQIVRIDGVDSNSTNGIWTQYVTTTVDNTGTAILNLPSYGVFNISTVGPANGTYTLTPACSTNQRMDAAGSGTTNGTPVDIWPANGAQNQKWILTFQPNSGTYKIQPAYATGMCLDVNGAGSTNGTAVQLYQDNGNTSQRWGMNLVNGGYTLAPACAGGSRLDVTGGSASWGTKLEIYQANGNISQTWSINPG